LIKIHQLDLLVEIMVVAMSERRRHLRAKMRLSCLTFCNVTIFKLLAFIPATSHNIAHMTYKNVSNS